jgi:hypothetical protein
MSDTVKIEVNIKQHVLKSDIENIDVFKERFEDPDPYFHHDDFADEIEIEDLSFDSEVGKCLDEGETFSRIIDCTISFKVNSIDKLKEFWDEIIVDNKVEWQRFGFYWIGDINPVFLDFDDETGEETTVSIDAFEVTGTMQLKDEVLK